LKGLIYKGFNIASTKKWKNPVEHAQVTENGMSKANKIQDSCTAYHHSTR